MRIYGIDFTSAPSRQKPITVACSAIESDVLTVSGFQKLESLDDFASFLENEGPWIGGFDFPFSQPRKFIENIGYPTNWSEMMAAFSKLDKAELERLLFNYRTQREPGDKQHLRQTDAIVKSISPMMIHGVPVAKMFHTGAVQLWRSRINIPVLRPTKDNRVALEIYPALVARKFVGRNSYKTDSKSKDTAERTESREKILAGIVNESVNHFGIRVDIPQNEQQQILEDFRGDLLDAVAAALITAWASAQPNYSIPKNVDELEGWIIDISSQ